MGTPNVVDGSRTVGGANAAIRWNPKQHCNGARQNRAAQQIN